MMDIRNRLLWHCLIDFKEHKLIAIVPRREDAEQHLKMLCPFEEEYHSCKMKYKICTLSQASTEYFLNAEGSHFKFEEPGKNKLIPIVGD